MKLSLAVELLSSPDEYLRLYAFERFEDGSGYKASIDIVSSCFSCVGKECYFDDLQQFYADSMQAYQQQTGRVLLKDMHEKDHFKFDFTHFGHVLLSGVLYSPSNTTQHLSFFFETDQSYVLMFLKQMKEVLTRLNMQVGVGATF